MPADALLSTAEAAARLGVTDTRVRLLIRQGRLPAQRIGARSWALRVEDVDAFERRKPGRIGRRAATAAG